MAISYCNGDLWVFLKKGIAKAQLRIIPTMKKRGEGTQKSEKTQNKTETKHK